MLKLLLFVLAIQPLTLLAQGSYTFEGKVDALKDGDKIYMVYQTDDGQKTDSALVQNGRFIFKGKLQEPVQSSLFLNKNPYVEKLAKGETMDYLKFYLEPAQFMMTAPDSLKNVQIKGSRINDLNKEIKTMLQTNDDRFIALHKEFEALPKEQQKDKQVLDGFIAREKELMIESDRIVLAFVKKHPDSWLSLYRLSFVAAEPAVSQEASEAFHLLSPALQKTPLGKGIVMKLEAPEKTEIGKTAPDFEQSAPDGKKLKLSEFRSKYVLLDFWASWCGPCRAENPNVVKAYNAYKDKGFTVLGVSLDRPGQKKAWLEAIEKDQLTWSQVSDLKWWDNVVAKLYGVQSIPANFLIDPSGKIIARDLRGKDLEEKLAEIFAGNATPKASPSK